jgi:hypothetical protein
MIPVKEVRLRRAEGPAALCGARAFPGFAEATAWLRSQASTLPPPGRGYDKVFYTITFSDGHSFRGRLDCKRHDVPDVEKEFVGYCTWMAGRARNPQCGEDQYRLILDRIGMKAVASFAALLDQYLPGLAT